MSEPGPELDILSKEAIDRIAAAIPGGERINPAVLEVAAGGYLESTRREGLVHERGMRTDIKALRRRVSALADELQNLPARKLVLLGVALELNAKQIGRPGIKRVLELGSELRQLEQSVEWFLSRASRPISGGEVAMPITISILGSAYWRATGKRPTHSSGRDGQHLGRPQSRFGKLVVAFFREVDPSIPETALTTAVRSYISSEISKVPPTA